MLRFRDSADSHAKDVFRVSLVGHAAGGKPQQEKIGSIQWHPGSEKRFVAYFDIIGELSLSELEEITRELKNTGEKRADMT